ncbi:MAG: NADH-quinone oxidoreductase subunit NuoG, partial [Candidatus Latescibacterota bacterium]
MPTLYVDGRPGEVRAGLNLLEACLSLGYDLPYFCWHPALGSVGACRQCAVKLFRDEADTQGRIVMACMTPATEGTRVSIVDPEARSFRRSVIEWLMANHPHDCPVCDEGGECHLQDMTLMSGHLYREYRFDKRTHRNQDLGPCINHEMNRCIQCYRCVRFYRDYAGGGDLEAFASHDHVYFGRHQDGTLESEFSGNLVEVCPTGVFTDKTAKEHYTRRWDLQEAPSVCVHCGVGCSITPGERYGTLRRIRNRYHGAVNGYFLCDRGRFGYEFVNDAARVQQVLGHSESGEQGPAGRDEVLGRLGRALASGAGVIGIGSPRATLEANFALRELVGAASFYQGAAGAEQRLTALAVRLLQQGPASVPTLREVREADAALVLGEDVTNTAPLVALALRQTVRRQPMALAARLGIPEWNDYAVRGAVQQARGPLFVAAVDATRLDDVATRTYRATPVEIARLGFAVAHALDPRRPSVPDLPPDVADLAAGIATALASAARPVVVSGPSLGSEAVLAAAAAVAAALCTEPRRAGLCLTAPECNSVGAALIGGGSLDEALARAAAGGIDTVIVLENDLYRRADRAAVDALFAAVRSVVVVDHLLHETARRAEVVLPAGTFAEGDGTLVSGEGRAQRLVQVFMPEGGIQESWRWLRDVGVAAGRLPPESWPELDRLIEAMVVALPGLAGVAQTTPEASYRVAGLRIPRQSHRYSGRTAMRAHLGVREGGLPQDPDSSLAFSMEGYHGPLPAALAPQHWVPGWNSVQAVTRFQEEINGPLRGGDPGARLLSPGPGGPPDGVVPPAPSDRDPGEWLAVPLYHIFGSEELSVRTPALAQRSSRPYVALSPAD